MSRQSDANVALQEHSTPVKNSRFQHMKASHVEHVMPIGCIFLGGFAPGDVTSIFLRISTSSGVNSNCRVACNGSRVNHQSKCIRFLAYMLTLLQK